MRKTINFTVSAEQLTKDARRLQKADAALSLEQARDRAAQAQGYESLRHFQRVQPKLSHWDGEVGIDLAREFVIPVPGYYLVCDKGPGNDEKCSYVRFVDVDLGEIVYWNSDEWTEDPHSVMNVVLEAYRGALCSHPNLRKFPRTNFQHQGALLRDEFTHEYWEGIRVKGGYVMWPTHFATGSYLAVYNEKRQEVYRWVLGSPEDGLVNTELRADAGPGAVQGWLDDPEKVMAQIMKTLRSGVQAEVPSTALVKCYSIEYDRNFAGGNYHNVGNFLDVPVIMEEATEVAFTKLTGLPEHCIVHYTVDETYLARPPKVAQGGQ